ncbi:MAG TPA: hypothetical protein VD866_10355 [Urbifossiella sp.]|nr:hypothetical protein [Urbifossiella sp.]
MYSMVLMAAMLPSGDAAGFGKRNNGCNGGCHGTVAMAGCTGHVASAGCTGVVDAGCTGSCHGRERGGFLGLRNRDRGNSCNGGGFLGGHKNKGNSCNGGGYAGCNGGGYAAPAGCVGGGIVVPTTPTPVVMPPKS